MRLYRGLGLLFPRSYRAKLLVVMFGGTTLPLALLALWLLTNNGAPPEDILVGTVIAACLTLIGTLLAMIAVYHLLTPLRRAADALDAYYNAQALPRLPEVGHDEMGRLLRGINRCLLGVDAGVRELERLALQDPLTGAMNRRGCDQLLTEIVGTAGGSAQPFVLAVVDLDNLKPINDAYGHAAGDRALIALVARAESWLRSDEWIGRWGGDEFLIGLRDPLPEALDRLTAWVEALTRADGDEQPVQISAGCAALRPGEDAMQLYRRADAAMYNAKFDGGSKVFCDDLPLHPTAAVVVATADAAGPPR